MTPEQMVRRVPLIRWKLQGVVVVVVPRVLTTLSVTGATGHPAEVPLGVHMLTILSRAKQLLTSASMVARDETGAELPRLRTGPVVAVVVPQASARHRQQILVETVVVERFPRLLANQCVTALAVEAESTLHIRPERVVPAPG